MVRPVPGDALLWEWREVPCLAAGELGAGGEPDNLCLLLHSPIRGPFNSFLFVFLPPVAAFSHLTACQGKERRGREGRKN